jgi:hypothetical protein
MPAVTLLVKVYNNSELKLVSDFLNATLEGLKVKAEVHGVTSRGWVQATVAGEDEKIALNYLTSEVGLCPAQLESLRRFSTVKGRVATLNRSKGEILVDIGVFSPNVVDATILLHHLQAQLVDGRKIALSKLDELFGLCKSLPLMVKILNIDMEKGRIEAMLPEKQLIQYGSWTKSLLDRLIVLGADLHDVESVLKAAECNRDVVSVEPLGLFEHALVCKLGTDAAGLIPKIGRNLRQATFSVFSPRRILKFLGDDSNLRAFS